MTDSIELRLKALELENKTLREDLDSVKSSMGKKPKKKRAPSAYNLFVKEAMPYLKEQYPDKPTKELFSMAGKEWKKHKENNESS